MEHIFKTNTAYALSTLVRFCLEKHTIGCVFVCRPHLSAQKADENEDFPKRFRNWSVFKTHHVN